jgi:transcriptional regulator with XRE-family HTH domain
MTRGDYMRKAREDAGLTLRELSAISGIHINTISRYELGIYQGCIDNIEILADSLGLTIDEYVGHERVKNR